MEEKIDENVSNESSTNPIIKCLICGSRDIIKSNVSEQLKLFESLIEQKTEDKLSIDTVGFCQTCSDSLESYKKLKVSCIRAWKIRRESTNLVPVIVTPELKLFRIEETQPYIMKKDPPVIKGHVGAVVRKSKPPVQYPQIERDPLELRQKPKPPVKYHPYKFNPIEPSLKIENNYCYVCKGIKSNLYKHLILAHCLIGKNSERTCNECRLIFNDEASFFKHFAHYHNEKAVQRPIITKTIKKRPNYVRIEKIPISHGPIMLKVTKKQIKQEEDAT